jgi:hypothetical protein
MPVAADSTEHRPAGSRIHNFETALELKLTTPPAPRYKYIIPLIQLQGDWNHFATVTVGAILIQIEIGIER